MGLAILIGRYHSGESQQKEKKHSAQVSQVPDIGRILVLNGCGITGAGAVVAGFLRDRGFDVKNTQDADSWNYTSTIILSKTKDMTIARQVAKALSADNILLMRDGDETYDVAVIIGSDFGELIQ
jgi:hypothetical protein